MSEGQLREAFALLESGRLAAARAAFAALSQSPAAAADALNGLGLCAEAVRDLSGAEAAYRQAIGLREEPEFLNNLAICLQAQGRGPEALDVFIRLSELSTDAQTLFNLALALAQIGRTDEALEALRRLFAHHPRSEAPLMPLLELIEQHLPGQALLALLAKRQAAQPAEPFYQLALAHCYDARKQSELAILHYRSALRANPALLSAYRELIHLLHVQGQYGESLLLARKLLAQDPSSRSRTELLSSLQHPLPASTRQAEAARREALELLEAWIQSPPALRSLPRPAALPFYFCYQTGLDKPLQSRLAAFYASCLSPAPAPPAQPRPERRPRLGVFSTRLYRHSVTDLLQRAVETLFGDRQSFESFLCYCPLAALGGREDAVTSRLSQLAEHCLRLPEDVQQAAARLAGLELDILIFLDVGMEAYSYALALKRLARFQLVTPGHPVTTGMPTMDYFISAEALEPPDSEAFYTEQLVRLPGLPDYARPTPPPPATRAELGLSETRHLYFCPMTIFKLQPAFDALLAEILSTDPEGLILLLEYKNQLHLKLRERFAQRFPLLAPRLQFLPWAPQEVFFQRLLAADVILDSFPFGGGNTAYQALGLGCPIVCLDVPWNKGRWTQAMYQLMQLPELIAANESEYVELAVALAADKARQSRLREQLRIRSEMLFDNPTWSQALQNFCQGLVAQP